MNFQVLIDSLDLLLIGLAFVLGVLWLLYGICYVVGQIFKAYESKASAAAAAPTPVATAAPAQATSEADDHILVIAAAISQLMDGQNYRILSVRPLNHTAWSDWAREGRCGIFTSHRVR